MADGEVGVGHGIGVGPVAGGRRISWPRVAGVTLALAPVGAVTGAALGAAVLWTIMLLHGEWSWAAFDPSVMLAPCLLGAFPGAVFAPAVGWAALRRVPLGRALGGCFAGGWIGGAVVGTVVVALRQRAGDAGFVATIGGTVLGVVIAAARLWHQARRAPTDS